MNKILSHGVFIFFFYWFCGRLWIILLRITESTLYIYRILNQNYTKIMTITHCNWCQILLWIFLYDFPSTVTEWFRYARSRVRPRGGQRFFSRKSRVSSESRPLITKTAQQIWHLHWLYTPKKSSLIFQNMKGLVRVVRQVQV